jgi:hypothetical protein
MTKRTAILAAMLLALVLASNPIKADDDPKPPPKPALPATVPVLTDEALGVLLEQMGYEPKAQKAESGGPFYSVEFEQDGWTFRYTVSLSHNKKFLWVSTNVCTLAPEVEPSAEALLKLLEENYRIGPTTISYDKKYKQIRVALALFNRGVTAAVLRDQLSQFTTNVQKVSKLCEPFRTVAKDKKPPTPPVDDDDK